MPEERENSQRIHVSEALGLHNFSLDLEHVNDPRQRILTFEKDDVGIEELKALVRSVAVQLTETYYNQQGWDSSEELARVRDWVHYDDNNDFERMLSGEQIGFAELRYVLRKEGVKYNLLVTDNQTGANRPSRIDVSELYA